MTPPKGSLADTDSASQQRPPRRPPKRRALRHPYTAAERARIREGLHIDGDERWRFRFAMLLGLSLVIAVMGMSANSSAVVIGAMLVAPLMSPVLALAYGIATGWPRRIFLSFFTVLWGSVGCIGLAAFLAWMLPDLPLNEEIIARTRPDVRDLMVALAAGTAGAYATVREGNSSLPGVAVAVALVPPLAAVGLTLEAGRYTLALGALLLYLANLAAIVLSGIAVLIGSGFVPWRRVAKVGDRVALGTGLALVCVLAVGIPLVNSSLDTFDKVGQAQEEERLLAEVEETIDEWLTDTPGLERTEANVDLDRGFVRVSLAGTGVPPSRQALAGMLLPLMGDNVRVVVNQLDVVGPNDPEVSEGDDVVDTAAISEAVQAWLDGQELPADDTFEVVDVAIDETDVVVTVAASQPPPEADAELAEATDPLVGGLRLVLDWRRSASAATGGTDDEELARRVAENWAVDEGLAVDRVVISGGDDRTVRVDLSGPRRPDRLTGLHDDLEEAFGTDITLDASLALRVPLTVEPTTPELVTPTTDEAPSTSTSTPPGGSSDLGPGSTAPSAGTDPDGTPDSGDASDVTPPEDP